MSYIILKRIAKNHKYYILKVYDLDNKEIIYKYLDRINENFINIDDIKDFNFIDFDTNERYDINKDELMKKIKIPISSSKYKIHRFDQNKVGMRKINYSIFDKEDRTLFVPCCGKHILNDEIRKLWGKYIDTYLFFEEKISGYKVYDTKKFNFFILGINDSMLKINFINDHNLLIKDFFDYLGINGKNVCISKENDKEYKLKIVE